MPLHQTCQLTLLNFIRQDCYIVNKTHMPAGLEPLHVENCFVAACWSSAIPCRELLCRCSYNIYMSAGPNTAAVQTCLLVSVAARWMLAGLWPLNQHACRPFVTQYCMSAVVVLLYLLYLLVWCLTISRAGRYGVSLSAVPAGRVFHYRSCLLVWYLTISENIT